MAIRTLSVCSGIGGLDLGLKVANSRIRTICYVEREAFAAAVLVARMAEQALDLAPVWDDFTTLRGEDFCGCLDLVVGGIPCQPYSAAGKGLCENDERDLWSTMARFLRESGSPALFLENVSAFVPRAMDRVLWDLAQMGLHAEWGVFSNESLGAPHRRERVFLLAYTERFLLRLQQGRGGGESGQGKAEPGFAGENVSNSSRERERQLRQEPRREQPSETDLGRNRAELGHAKEFRSQQGSLPIRNGSTGSNVTSRGCELANPDSCETFSHRPESSGESSSLGDPEGSGLEEGCRESQFSRPANRNLPFWPPGQDPELWKEWPEHFWPSSERAVCGAPDGVPSWLELADQYRTDRLRALGNAVSPPVAAVAWRVLTDRAEKRG